VLAVFVLNFVACESTESVGCIHYIHSLSLFCMFHFINPYIVS
jgi:hypothetical protein